MNIPAEIVQIQEFVWNQIQDAIQRERTFSALMSLLIDLTRGVWLPLLVSLFLIALAVFFYQPRIPRGALWVPAFGIFGGTPKFYTHSRPASVFGLLLKTRHRAANRRRAKSQ
ncbi:MAG: hypothetical protein FJ403_07100 [Verrucomicrobia bacterium]|nr:hypothetical protein [Verrucomicrobiota bacterium]